MIKKIIVPVDFSKFSEHALQSAAYLAIKYNAEITVVHLLDLPTSAINQTDGFKSEQTFFKLKLAQKNFKEFLQKEYLKEVTLKPVIKSQKDFKELNSLALEEAADLIVMGSHGAFGLKELFVGSNTEKVVRNSKIPVLVTKGVPIVSDFKTAVFACDFSDDDIQPYKKAKELLELLGCQIQLLHVNTPRSKFITTKKREAKIASFLEKADGNTDKINNVAYVSEHSVEGGILEFANTHGKDLIIMATHGKKGLEHFLDGSFSEDIANHATLPVLTFRI